MQLIQRVLKLFGGGLLLGILIALGAYLYIYPSLPPVAHLRDVRLRPPLRVMSADGELLAVYGTKRRIPLNFDEIPPLMRKAFIASEDARFYDHPGVDVQALARAAIDLMQHGRIRQGGSTITMQLARNFYLTRQRQFIRKLREIFLALRIEQTLDKEEILTLYLNKIFLGQRAYGVGAAAEVYYGTTPQRLTLAQIATLAGLPKAPSALNPISNPAASVVRRTYVLNRMLNDHHITPQQYEVARNARVSAQPRQRIRAANSSAPYAAEMARAEMVRRYGSDAYTAGYTVHTTLRHDLQLVANASVRRGLIRYDLRHGWRGATRRLEPIPGSRSELDQALREMPTRGGFRNAVITHAGDDVAHAYLGDGHWAELTLEEIRWARRMRSVDFRGPIPQAASEVLRSGDMVRLIHEDGVWRLRQVPEANGALVALDPINGAILALTGGFDFSSSKFNRVTQARRQPGSGFKPFVYAAALERGYTPATLINDAPVVYHDQSIEGVWRPSNYSRQFYGPTRLREALMYSRNVVSVRILDHIGTAYARNYVARFGFDPDALPDNLTLALGSCEVTPMGMVSAYAILANGGYKIEPYLIERIDDAAGEPVFIANARRACDAQCRKQLASATPVGDDLDIPLASLENFAPRVLDQRIHYQTVSMLQDVARQGTARSTQALERNDLAGKTGTTNDQRDAWFIGFGGNLVAASWVGRDNFEKLGQREVGGVAALPIWIDFMKRALAGRSEQELPLPSGIVQARIDPENGLLAKPGSEDSVVETFREELVPNRISHDDSLMPDDPLMTETPEMMF